ncbi:MAG TPA: DUF1858 domain-containing protein [Elusimicrobiales bacterium]|nr:DUF1858 domain-containing protein [Elusimicrobiales bacterium]
MEAKIIDLDRTLYDLTTEHPELIDMLFELGFMGVKNPVMRETHGKQMTVRAGCGHLGIEIGKVKAALEAKGFEVKN